MKKFLAFLLIAVIACMTVEEEMEFNSWLSNLWNKIKNAVKKAWNWLKEKGYLSKIKDALVKLGKTAAIALCKKWFDAQVCEGIINGL